MKGQVKTHRFGDAVNHKYIEAVADQEIIRRRRDYHVLPDDKSIRIQKGCAPPPLKIHGSRGEG